MSISRQERCIITLYDLTTREGATAASVKKKMKKWGYTAAEIAEAASKMAGTHDR